MNRRLVAYGISSLALGWLSWVAIQHEVWEIRIPAPQWTLLLVLTLLMPLNWGIEVAKWAWLNPELSRRNALREVLIGSAWAILTPNRIGDLAGRVAAASGERREQASRAFVTSSGSQLLVTLVAGAFALGKEVHWFFAVAVGFATLSYFRWSPRIPKSIRLRIGMTEAPAPPSPAATRTVVMVMSTLRYLIFAGQFWLSFRAFGLTVAGQKIPLIFLGNALVPSAALGELGIREALSLAVIAPEGEAVGGVVMAAFVVWFVNLVVPAAAGAIWQLWQP